MGQSSWALIRTAGAGVCGDDRPGRDRAALRYAPAAALLSKWSSIRPAEEVSAWAHYQSADRTPGNGACAERDSHKLRIWNIRVHHRCEFTAVTQ
jgi:hypothetical protein